MMDLNLYDNLAIGPFELFFLIMFRGLEARGLGYYSPLCLRLLQVLFSNW
jgi:hypothetical protein